jgi:TDG/mug DNA glycosylase family protein
MSGFEPIIGVDSEVLILGSMPSVISLDKAEYYAHSRNCFWWIMSEIYNFDINQSYDQRCELLLQNKIAVWDVLHDCERQGSLDSAIVRNSEVVNDFQKLFLNYTSLTKVIFNGAAAERIFKRYVAKLKVNQSIDFQIEKWHRCPSTSPAHASLTKQSKLHSWSLALDK